MVITFREIEFAPGKSFKVSPMRLACQEDVALYGVIIDAVGSHAIQAKAELLIAGIRRSLLRNHTPEEADEAISLLPLSARGDSPLTRCLLALIDSELPETDSTDSPDAVE